jgi:predicted secreted hydrolase
MKYWKQISVIFIFSALIILVMVTTATDRPTVEASLVVASSPQNNLSFARADSPREFSFPADHGPHPEFQTEWWYYTGNLVADDGQRFGYQLTFFRRALLPVEDVHARNSAWATSQVYMAHFALSAVDEGEYFAFERFARGAADLAGARSEPFQVWLEDWSVVEVPLNKEKCPETVPPPCNYQLTAKQGDVILDLFLSDAKGPILQGDQGYSRKGAELGQASYYYSLTRLETKGFLQVGKQRLQVTGLSWMDHEFSTSALSMEQVGWDWFSFQFSDGSELMLFQIRRNDGSIDPFSSGTWIAPDGSTTHIEQDEFLIQVTDNWKSPSSKATYPAGWRIDIPALNLTLQAEPSLADQELRVSYTYWEGTVQAFGSRDGFPFQGSGYVELTGYLESMGGEF